MIRCCNCRHGSALCVCGGDLQREGWEQHLKDQQLARAFRSAYEKWQELESGGSNDITKAIGVTLKIISIEGSK